MFTHYRTSSFILGETSRGEADKIFLVYSEDFGRIEILGKSIRKMTSKLRGGIPLFSLSQVEFIQGKRYKILTDAILIEDFEIIKKDLERLAIAYKISELFDELIKPPQKDPQIYQLLNEALNLLNNYSLSTTHYSLIYNYFFWNLLSLLGYGPELYYCLICKQKLKPENLFFSQQGGIVCQGCQEKQKDNLLETDANVVKFLREILKRDFKRLTKIKIRPKHEEGLKEVSDFYISHVRNI